MGIGVVLFAAGKNVGEEFGVLCGKPSLSRCVHVVPLDSSSAFLVELGVAPADHVFNTQRIHFYTGEVKVLVGAEANLERPTLPPFLPQRAFSFFFLFHLAPRPTSTPIRVTISWVVVPKSTCKLHRNVANTNQTEKKTKTKKRGTHSPTRS